MGQPSTARRILAPGEKSKARRAEPVAAPASDDVGPLRVRVRGGGWSGEWVRSNESNRGFEFLTPRVKYVISSLRVVCRCSHPHYR